MADILSLAGNLASNATPWGALIGGVFSWGKKWLDNRHEEKKAEMAYQERALDRQHDLALADREIEKETRLATIRLDESMFVADSQALTIAAKSQDAEISAMADVLEGAGDFLRWFAGFVFVCVTAVQKLTRPGLTFCLFCLTCYFYYEVNKLIGGLATKPSNELAAIHSRIIFSGLNMAELSMTFWYMGRPTKK
ncbi:MAG: hypothetical protein KKD73_01580 [Proteobacteria bacterium]|nr:hypothetical protein [Pseudomonadota bacterium]MBU1640061.1 hypothetical protein [Pseudomonadota bacterium]